MSAPGKLHSVLRFYHFQQMYSTYNNYVNNNTLVLITHTHTYMHEHMRIDEKHCDTRVCGNTYVAIFPREMY